MFFVSFGQPSLGLTRNQQPPSFSIDVIGQLENFEPAVFVSQMYIYINKNKKKYIYIDLGKL